MGSAIDRADENRVHVKLPDDFFYNLYKPKAQKEFNKQWASQKDGASIGDSKTLNTTYKGVNYSSKKYWNGVKWIDDVVTPRTDIETSPLPDAPSNASSALSSGASGGGGDSPSVNTGGSNVSGSPSFAQSGDNIFGFKRSGKRRGMSSLLGF